MSLDKFVSACGAGDLAAAQAEYEQNPAVLNQRDSLGWTGLTRALSARKTTKSHPNNHTLLSLPLVEWLLSLPTLDTNVTNRNSFTGLHYACTGPTPLDIIILLARYSRWETVTRPASWGHTALDLAMMNDIRNATLYLTWLGVDCHVMYKLNQFKRLTLKTWEEESLTTEAAYWAVAAGDVSALRELAAKVTRCPPVLDRSLLAPAVLPHPQPGPNPLLHHFLPPLHQAAVQGPVLERKLVRLDRARLARLAEVFPLPNNAHRTSLESLAWEKVLSTTRVLAATPSPALLELGVPGHVVKVFKAESAARWNAVWDSLDEETWTESEI